MDGEDKEEADCQTDEGEGERGGEEAAAEAAAVASASAAAGAADAAATDAATALTKASAADVAALEGTAGMLGHLSDSLLLLRPPTECAHDPPAAAASSATATAATAGWDAVSAPAADARLSMCALAQLLALSTTTSALAATTADADADTDAEPTAESAADAAAPSMLVDEIDEHVASRRAAATCRLFSRLVPAVVEPAQLGGFGPKNLRTAHLEYAGIVRRICALEQHRQEFEARRRFFHYAEQKLGMESATIGELLSTHAAS